MARKAAVKLPRASEDQIHKAVIEHIRIRGVRSMVTWHTPNGGLRGKAEAAKLKAMGTRAGIPDVFILAEGKLYGLELKTEVGTVSLDQKVTMNLLRCAGCTVAVAYGLDDALRILTGWNLIRHPMPPNNSTPKPVQPPPVSPKRRGGRGARPAMVLDDATRQIR